MTILLAIRAWIGRNPRAAFVVAFCLLAALVLLGAYLKGRDDAADKAEAVRRVEATEALRRDAGANFEAAAVAQQHADTAARRKEELINAVAEIPDSAPAPVAVAAACIELCDQGRPVADLPACGAVAAQVRTCPPRGDRDVRHGR